MPRKGKKRATNGVGAVFRMRGVTFARFIPSFAAVYNVSITPRSATACLGLDSTILNGIGDSFMWYRFKRLGVEIIGGSLFSTGNGTIAYYPQTGLSANPSHNQNQEAPWSMSVWDSDIIYLKEKPGRVHWVPPKLLAPLFVKWYKCGLSGSPDDLEIQGILCHTWDATQDGTATYRVHYEIEYKDPVPPAVTTATMPVEIKMVDRPVSLGTQKMASDPELAALKQLLSRISFAEEKKDDDSIESAVLVPNSGRKV